MQFLQRWNNASEVDALDLRRRRKHGYDSARCRSRSGDIFTSLQKGNRKETHSSGVDAMVMYASGYWEVNSEQKERAASGTTSQTTKCELFACLYCLEKRFKAIWYPILPRPMKLVLSARWKGIFVAACTAQRKEGSISKVQTDPKWMSDAYGIGLQASRAKSRWMSKSKVVGTKGVDQGLS